MLELGPRWMRRSPDPQAVEPSLGSTTSAAADAIERSGTLEKSRLVDAIASGLGCGFFRWPAQSRIEQGPADLAPVPDSWLVLGLSESESAAREDSAMRAQNSALLEAMLGAIGAIGVSVTGTSAPDRTHQTNTMELVESHRILGVLVLGQQAAQAVFGLHRSVESLRATVHRLALGPSTIPLIVTFSVQHLRQHPSDKAGAWRDLNLARAARAQGSCFPMSDTESNLA